MGDISRGAGISNSTGISSIRDGDFELGASGIVASISPIFLMPLESNLDFLLGTGAATFTRSTTGTFVDKDDELIKTAAIDAARFETNGILIEGASTNLLKRSEEFDDAAWLKNTVIVTANQATAPDGANTADQISYVGSAGSPNTRRVDQTVSIPGGTANKTITISEFARSVSGTSKLRLQNTHSGVTGSFSSDLTATTEFQRFEFTVTNSASAGNGNQAVGINAASDDSAFDLYGFGSQLEQDLPFASSYIPTTTTSVTRALDKFNIPSINIPAPTNDYTISMELDILGLDSTKTQTVYSVDGETSRKIEINTTTGLVEATHGAVTSTSTTALVAGIKTKIAFVVDGTNQTLYINGAQEDQDVKGTVTGTATAISIGNAAGLNQLFGHERDVRIHDVALTSEQVAAL